MAIQLDVFVCVSVTKSVTEFEPRSAQLNAAGVTLIEKIPQASVEPLLIWFPEMEAVVRGDDRGARQHGVLLIQNAAVERTSRLGFRRPRGREEQCQCQGNRRRKAPDSSPHRFSLLRHNRVNEARR